MAAGALLLGLATGWSVRALVAGPTHNTARVQPVEYTVAEGSVGRSLRLNTKAGWTGGSKLRVGQSGTLTGVHRPSADGYRAGDPVLDISLKPVIAARGALPMFRDLGVGSKGPDVRQLQQLLLDVKIRTTAPDGIYGQRTLSEVSALATRLRVSTAYLNTAGSILFVPTLPSRLALDPALALGDSLTAGQVIGHILSAKPQFTMTLPQGQAVLAAVGQTVLLEHESGPWEAQISALTSADADGTVTATLGPSKGQSSICGSGCSALPTSGALTLPSRLVIVPEVRGPAIPVSALLVAVDGSASVKARNGSTIPVTVLSSAGGMAVVKGIDIGTVIQLAEAIP